MSAGVMRVVGNCIMRSDVMEASVLKWGGGGGMYVRIKSWEGWMGIYLTSHTLSFVTAEEDLYGSKHPVPY